MCKKESLSKVKPSTGGGICGDDEPGKVKMREREDGGWVTCSFNSAVGRYSAVENTH